MGRNPSSFKIRKNPVENVSWDNAVDFCKRLTEQTGKPFRLPTEAEWEYACRSGSQTLYCFGDSDGDLEEYAWFKENSGEKTHPVGELKPNVWGLYDMHGNVWEWCTDWYDFNYYNKSPRKNPTGPGEAVGVDRVLRGGSWINDARWCRSTCRYAGYPSDRFNFFGFRLSRGQ